MKQISIIALFLFVVSCSNEKTTSENLSSNFSFASNTSNNHVFKNEFGIEAYYVGYFEASVYDDAKNVMYSNKITISIDSLSETICFGHSIVAGNMRPFKGSYKKNNDNTFEVTAKEPGDDKYDGSFVFVINANSNKIIGKWNSNDKNLAVTEREYELERKTFEYNPDLELPEYLTYEGLYGTYKETDTSTTAESLTDDIYKFNASKVLLKSKDIENMYLADLEVMRNAIYARHGYSFKNRKMRFLFDHAVEWYMPISTNITNDLTDIEKQNIELLKRYEKHAVKYYDSFGR
ncbi:MAG: YARHG domain-containing protein [Bacteroidetes bacterium]|nr:YARHG domain-containing protein [Bacteroidota bacterium]